MRPKKARKTVLRALRNVVQLHAYNSDFSINKLDLNKNAICHETFLIKIMKFCRKWLKKECFTE